MENKEEKSLAKVVLKELGKEYCDNLLESLNQNEEMNSEYDEKLDTDPIKVRKYLNRINGKNSQVDSFDVSKFPDKLEKNLIEFKDKKVIEDKDETVVIDITQPKLISEELTKEEIENESIEHYCEQLTKEMAISNYVYDNTRTLIEAKLEEMYRMPTTDDLEVEEPLRQYLYPIKEVLYYKDGEKILPLYNVKDKKPVVIEYNPLKIEKIVEQTIEEKLLLKDKLDIIRDELESLKRSFPSNQDDSYRKDTLSSQEQVKNMDDYMELKQRGRFLEDEIITSKKMK